MAETFGDRIRRRREDRKLSQQELADQAGVHRDTVVRAEQSGNVGILLIYQLAEALRVDITEFFGAPSDREVPASSQPDVWNRLNAEQRAQLLRLAYRWLGERVPREET